MIATTLRIANQNSNSPKFFTPIRLMAVKNSMKVSEASGTDSDGHTVASRPAAPTDSAAITITSCAHHNQPTVAPAVAPMASAAYTENAPLAGLAAAISPRAFMTMITSAPATRYDTSTAGPAACTPTPEPRNRPAPIALPSPIMISCRGLRACPSCAGKASAAAAEETAGEGISRDLAERSGRHNTLSRDAPHPRCRGRGFNPTKCQRAHRG